MASKERLIIGLSGASGVIYGIRLLQLLRPLPVETHLVITRAAEVTLAHETDLKVQQVQALADHVHAAADMAAPISSGSFKTAGMIVAPCSIKSAAEIATGATSTLLTRAADVTLKERRRLVLMVRETRSNAAPARPRKSLPGRSSALTECPRAANSCTRLAPIKPDAPVTKQFIVPA